MTRLTTLFFILTLIVGCNFSDKEKMNIKELLTEGEHNVIIYEEVIIDNPRLLELEEKYRTAIQENYDWFIEYGKQNQLPLPYHKKMGLTKTEYKELQGYYETSKVQLKETDREILKVNFDNNLIRFSSSGVLEFFNKISINLTDSSIQMVDNKLNFEDEITVTDNENIFKSKWKGFKWSYHYPEVFDTLSSDYINSKHVKSYSIIIGELEATHKTFIKLKGLEMNNGEKYVDFEAPILFE